MTRDELNLPIYPRAGASTTEFVKFWSRQWSGKDRKADEEYYNRHIKGPLTDDGLRDLFRWKNQMTLSAGKQRTLERIIARRQELVDLSPDIEAEDFLNQFREGRAIWWIFPSSLLVTRSWVEEVSDIRPARSPRDDFHLQR
jgi:hypothetical protein